MKGDLIDDYYTREDATLKAEVEKLYVRLAASEKCTQDVEAELNTEREKTNRLRRALRGWAIQTESVHPTVASEMREET